LYKATCILLTFGYTLHLQTDTKWGGLKAGQVMSQPQPIFARIEHKTEEDAETEAGKKPKKKAKNVVAQSA